MGRKASPTVQLAYRFVTEFIGREWTEADYRGQHIRNAKTLLAIYPEADIWGCLLALRDGKLGIEMAEIKSMHAIEWGEPPAIQRWQAYKQQQPPIYLKHECEDWRNRVYGSLEPEEQEANNVPVRTGELWSAPRKARRDGPPEPVASGSLPE